MPDLLIVLLGFATAAATQPAPRVARIGMLCPVTCNSGAPVYAAFIDELRKLGWIEGTTMHLERKEAAGSMDRLAELAGEIVRSKPDLILTAAPQPARAAKDATSEIPIVFLFVADPVGVGLAASLSHPGGNLTGIATLGEGGLIGKGLDLVREILPKAKRVAVFINPSNDTARLLFAKEAPGAAVKLGFELDVQYVREKGEIAAAIAAAKAGGAEAFSFVGDPIFHNPPDAVPDLVSKAGIPAFYLPADVVRAGGLMSYGPDFLVLARRGAHYIDKILRGAQPAGLPIEQPSKYLLAINLKTAKALGLEFPTALLARADEVIE